MLKKFYNLDFGLQMLIVCLSIILTNQLTTFSLSLANKPSTIYFNIGVILSLLMLILQGFSFYLGVMSIFNYIKTKKETNKKQNEQSN